MYLCLCLVTYGYLVVDDEKTGCHRVLIFSVYHLGPLTAGPGGLMLGPLTLIRGSASTFAYTLYDIACCLTPEAIMFCQPL